MIEDVDSWSATAENYKGRRDIEAVFRTVKPNGGTGVGTLFHYAKQYGFTGIKNSSTDLHLHITHAETTVHKPFKQANKYNALQIWKRCLPATLNEPYIKKKQGTPDGLRVYPASMPPLVICGRNVTRYLVVPCWSGDKL